MGGSPKAWYLAGTIDQESCISLKHKRCWDPSSEFKTSREQGVGFGQITRAYTQTGSIRFDALQELKDKYPKELKELSWYNIKTKPDLQLKAVVLKMRDNYKYYDKYTKDPLVFGMVSYNGGVGGLDKERRACKISSECDSNLWFNNVERFCLKSKTILYGKRSACDINREYPLEVIRKSTKYRNLWGK